MRRATVSLLGLYQYDNTILDGLVVPGPVYDDEEQQIGAGVDRQQVINNLLLEAAELEVLYPSAPFLKQAVEMWAQKQLPVWDRLYATTLLKYDPIYNFDRYEEYTDTEEIDSTNTGTSDGTNKVAGFNAAELVDQSGSSGSSTMIGDVNRTLKHSARLYGNIGVTTSQQMLTAEREVVRFNMVDIIVRDFIERFCLLVY